jgi:hypothetical protein
MSDLSILNHTATAINMKKVVITAFICILSLNLSAQHVAISEVAKIKIPVEAKPVTRERLHKSEKESNLSLIDESRDRENLYEIGNILIKIIPSEANEGGFDKNFFMGFEGDYRQIKPNSSFFKLTRPSIRNAKVICAQYEFDNSDRGQYSLTAVNSTNTKSIGIIIEYDIAERDKADKIFERILRSLKMKK